MILQLAWRNLFRHPIRTLLTTLAITFTSAILVFFVGIQRSSYKSMIDAATAVYLGHIQLQPAGYFDRPEIENTISAETINKISSASGLQAFAPRAHAFILISSANRTYGAQLTGVIPEREQELSTIPRQIVEGAYFTQRGSLPAVVIGATLAQNLGVSVGQEVTILGQAKDGSTAAAVAIVVGTFRSGAIELDRGMAQIELGEFQELFGLQNELHSVTIKLHSPQASAEFQSLVSPLLPPPAVTLRWDELIPGLKEAIAVDMAAGWLFFGLLVFISAMGLFNTLLMSVLERNREFGVMLTLGSNGSTLFRMLITESLLIISSGIASGIILGTAVLLYFAEVGFTVPGAEEVGKKWNIPSVIHPYPTVETLTLGPALVLALTVILSLYPAFRASRLNELEALRST